MKKILIYSLLFCLSVCIFADNSKIDSVFPNVLSLESIQPNEQVIIERIDFDLNSVKPSIEKQGRLREYAEEEYRSYVTKIDTGGKLFEYEKELYIDGDSVETVERIYESSFKRSLSNTLFDIFEGEAYFSEEVNVEESWFPAFCGIKLDSCASVIQRLTNTANASCFLSKVCERDEDIYYNPVALFLAKNGDDYCWIFVESWEYKRAAQPSTPFGYSVSFDSLGNRIKKPLYQPEKKLILGHIKGTVYNFDFTDEICSFRCL